MTKYLFILLFFYTLTAQAELVDKIKQKNWIHGAKNCDENDDPAIDTFQVDEGTYILRQSKCLHYEAPFIYVLFGRHSVFIQDTGATSDIKRFPLYTTVRRLVSDWENKHQLKNMNIIVTHSHSHDDHYAGDEQFIGQENVTVIAPNSQAVRAYFGFKNWPNGMTELELGERMLKVMPLPGHQKDALAVYDPQTKMVLSGDSFYPGRLYIRNWQQYKQSLERLIGFSNSVGVSAFLGTHIEMTNQPGKDFPMGATYHPNERHLVLTLADLKDLYANIIKQGNKHRIQALNSVIIYPVGSD